MCVVRYSLLKEVVDRLLDKQVGAIFQGCAEFGARALGNRSIICDPRLPDGKDIVNRIKNREWYRPFAATVLEEYAHEWFIMGKLKSSPYMLFAVQTIPDKIKQIPAVVHVDGTCRPQTVNASENPIWYNLIKEFNTATSVPMVLITSLNIAGEPLAHTEEDAMSILKRSKLNFIYFPEMEGIIE